MKKILVELYVFVSVLCKYFSIKLLDWEKKLKIKAFRLQIKKLHLTSEQDLINSLSNFYKDRRELMKFMMEEHPFLIEKIGSTRNQDLEKYKNAGIKIENILNYEDVIKNPPFIQKKEIK